MSEVEITPARLRSLIVNIQKDGGADNCWLWTAGTNAQGYPCGVAGPPAHRVVYEWLVGPIPAGLDLDHLCRVRHCVNPHHLEPVTKTENQLRRRRHGPFQPIQYCRRGHAMTGANRRLWSNGPDKPREVRCYLCHDGVEGVTEIRFRRTA